MPAKLTNKRSRSVLIRMTEDQYKALEKSADAYGISPTARAKMIFDAYEFEDRRLYVIQKYLEALILLTANENVVLQDLKKRVAAMADDFTLSDEIIVSDDLWLTSDLK